MGIPARLAAWGVIWAATAGIGCAASGSSPACSGDDDCPAGQVCRSGACVPGSDGGEDVGDAPDGDGAGDGGGTPAMTGFTSTGGAISGNNGTYRYQFSVGAPQPMGSGAGWTVGPGAVHRR